MNAASAGTLTFHEFCMLYCYYSTVNYSNKTYKFHLYLVWKKCDITIMVSGGDCGEWRRGEIQHDPALLPRNIHQNLQEDDRHASDTFPNNSEAWAGIFKQSMGARNREGIGLSYRPARLHRLAEFIPWNRFLGSINFKYTGSESRKI